MISVELRWMLAAVALLFGFGLWLMLPRVGQSGRGLGTLLIAVGLGLLGSQLPSLANWAEDSVFGVLAGVTLLAAVATITARNPVYSAIWFALALLTTAGLFVFQGSQFLGVATVVVYAGAILVTFLFVLMLAQPQGTAFYDRLSWEANISAFMGAALVALLTVMVFGEFRAADGSPAPAAPFTSEQLQTQGNQILAGEHMAHLGGQLFSQHLIAIEVAGTLLMVALVGTVGIVSLTRARPSNPGDVRGG